MNDYFREEIPEVTAIKNHLLKWSTKEWSLFRNGWVLFLPVQEYAFLLFDAGFDPKIDSPEKAGKLIYGEDDNFSCQFFKLYRNHLLRI